MTPARRQSADRQALINVVAAQQHVSKAQAANTVDGYPQQAQRVGPARDDACTAPGRLEPHVVTAQHRVQIVPARTLAFDASVAGTASRFKSSTHE